MVHQTHRIQGQDREELNYLKWEKESLAASVFSILESKTGNTSNLCNLLDSDSVSLKSSSLLFVNYNHLCPK